MPRRAWHGQAAQEALAIVKRRGRAQHLPCCICGRVIDYDLPGTDPMGCTVQHAKSRKRHPELTWVASNWRPAHSSCNKRWGDRDMPDDWGKSASRTSSRPNPTSGWWAGARQLPTHHQPDQPGTTRTSHRRRQAAPPDR